MKNITVNKTEIYKFSRLASEWWDPNGKFKPLHKFNPVRLNYIIKSILKEPVKYYEIKQNINEPEFTSLALQIFDEWLDEGLIKIN